MNLKFKHPLDTKSFIIGICASMTAVILWDIIKYNQKLLEHQKMYYNAEGSPGHKTAPIGSFQLCCLWGCDECEWTWGGGKWTKNKTSRLIRRR